MYKVMTTFTHAATRLLSGRRLRSATAAFFGGLIVAAPVWADDTEIFFGDVSENAAAPNLLLIVDTSGSMGSRVAGTGKTRMQNVQEGLHLLLNSLNNVNVGLMRFSNPGGPVLYQIENIDKNIFEEVLIDVTASIQDDDDDAQEIVDTGDMIIDGEKLEMVQTIVGTATSFVRPIQNGSDDAEEETWIGAGDNVLRINSDLELTHDDGRWNRLHIVGLRFTNLNIPPGAIITDAFIQFKVDNVTAGGAAEMRITGEMGDARPFQDSFRNISRRNRTSASVDWTLTQTARDEIISTPSLTPVVQEIVRDNPNWRGDGGLVSDMVFVFERRPGSTSVAEHDLQSYDRGDFEPRLSVSYYVGSPPKQLETLTGLRFANVNVPQNAKVTSAYIDFTSAQTDSAVETNLRIHGELSGNAAPYSAGAKISSRTPTSAAVDWKEIPTWDENNQTHTTPDLREVVQEMVNQADWCGGNAMAFKLEGEGLRYAWARDERNGLQPVLRVQYDQASIEAGKSCARASISKQITRNLDDVEEDGRNVWTGSNDLDLQSTSRRVGLRFTDLQVPQGAKILSAYLELYAEDDADDDPTTVRIEIQNTDDAEQFTNNNGTVDGRSWGAQTDWSFSNRWREERSYRSSDIGSLVQSVVNRGGWDIGNAMAFRLRKQSGENRRVLPYNEDPVR
ncbi:MAG: VWA domain-containing protein, partial [Halieaceae bacterium]|nr:VWA domain-containing protein [Halieaceae bacterium]